MDISYTYSLGLQISPTSPTVTLYCADKPSAPTIPLVAWKDINRIVLNWTPPNDNGSPILGYQLYMKLSTDPTYVLAYDGSAEPSQTYTTISTYLNNPLTIASYSFQLYAINIVGISAASPVLTVQINDTASPQYSIPSGSGLSSFPANTYENIVLQVIDLFIIGL
jgi:hypothetical protein